MGRALRSVSRRSVSRRSRRKTRKIRRHRRPRRQLGGAPGSGSSPFFQDAYAITLDPSSKRYTDIKAFATAAGVPLEPWKGVIVTPEQKDTLPEQGVGTTHYKDRTGAVFNLGVIGAFLAHRSLFREVAEKAPNKPGTLIFEDDVEIPADFYDRLAAVQSEIPADWDVIFLDKLYTVGKPISKHIVKLDKDMTGMKNWGIWAYIVKNASLKERILPKFEHMLDVPDIQLAKFGDTLNMYLINPSIVKQDARNALHSVVTVLDQQANKTPK
jgi:GR25 family glycosyltransferase involved in LPS biosynthesis